MKIKTIAKIIAICTAVGGCRAETEMSSSVISADINSTVGDAVVTLEEEESFSNECVVELGNTVSINGKGAWLDDNCIKISQSGVYTISGKLSDGMIFVETADKVKLILNNVEIENSDGPAIISNSEKLIIKSAENSNNSLKDSKDYSYSRDFEDELKHKSAVYSEGDLIVAGGGSLSIKARYGDAMTSGGTLSMKKGSLTIDAEDNGVIGADGITATNLELNITSENDCIKTGSDAGTSISVNNSRLSLVSEKNDGIQAEGLVFINGGELDILTSGDIESDTELSSKGIKGAEIKLTDADINISSTDHAVKSDGTIDLSGGKLEISSTMGKGVTADGALTVNDTEIAVTDAEEGLESKNVLTINSGNINIRSRDDGINTGGDEGDHSLNITGGYVYVNADGDGIDSNGNINIYGGTVVVFGSSDSENTALDCGDEGNFINIAGGKVIAFGSFGMMKAPRQGYLFSMEERFAAGGEVVVTDAQNNEIISATVPKSAQSVLFSDGTSAEGYKILSDGKELALTDIMNRGNGFSGRGEMPAFPENGQMPPSGEAPAFPENGQMPPSGEVPAFPENGQMPPLGEPPAFPENGQNPPQLPES